MRFIVHTALVIGCLPLFSTSVALGGEGVQVKITNDGTEDIMVTVYDMNTRPNRVVLENARINGFTSLPVNVIGDASGRANLSWTASSIDKNMHHCGHEEEVGVSDDASLNVHADSSCSA